MSARTYTPEPMKYHGPGWSVDLITDDENSELLQVWAPSQQRDYWAASWVRIVDGEDDPDHGGYAKGATFDYVVNAFKGHGDRTVIVAAFREAAGL